MSVHTCHADCPCQRGEQPAPDFLDSAWFVAVKADGSLDRDWPTNCDGRAAPESLMGDAERIVKVTPVRPARQRIEALESERDRYREALAETADDLTFAAAYLGDLPNDPAFSAAYKRLTQATDRVVAALTNKRGRDE